MSWLDSYIDEPDTKQSVPVVVLKQTADYYCSVECFNLDIE